MVTNCEMTRSEITGLTAVVRALNAGPLDVNELVPSYQLFLLEESQGCSAKKLTLRQSNMASWEMPELNGGFHKRKKHQSDCWVFRCHLPPRGDQQTRFETLLLFVTIYSCFILHGIKLQY